MDMRIINTAAAPMPVGPYSQAVVAGGFLFVSGQVPMNPVTGKLVTGSILDKTRQVLENIRAILEASGTDLAGVVKTTVYLRDLRAFDAVNQVYGEFFGQARPARTTIEVARLPRDAEIEMDAVAFLAQRNP